MVKKKVVELKGSWDDVESSDSKLNPDKSFGKSLLARLKKFKEKGERMVNTYTFNRRLRYSSKVP